MYSMLLDAYEGTSWSLSLIEWGITPFSKSYVASEWAVSHNVLYYQQLSIACYKASCYAYNSSK